MRRNEVSAEPGAVQLDAGTNNTTDKGGNKICCNYFLATQGGSQAERDVHNLNPKEVMAYVGLAALQRSTHAPRQDHQDG